MAYPATFVSFFLWAVVVAIAAGFSQTIYGLRKAVSDILIAALSANVNTWTLQPDGTWEVLVAGDDEPPFDLQKTLVKRAAESG